MHFDIGGNPNEQFLFKQESEFIKILDGGSEALVLDTVALQNFYY